MNMETMVVVKSQYERGVHGHERGDHGVVKHRPGWRHRQHPCLKSQRLNEHVQEGPNRLLVVYVDGG